MLRGNSAPDASTAEKAEKDKAAERERIEKVIEGRVKGIKGDLEKQVGSLTAERDALNSRLTAIQIDQGVTTVATKRGLRPTAIADITSRARCVFKLVNGAPAAFEADGKSVRYGRDGLTPMTLEEWVDTQVSEAPHLFESNAQAQTLFLCASPDLAQLLRSFRILKDAARQNLCLQRSEPA